MSSRMKPPATRPGRGNVPLLLSFVAGNVLLQLFAAKLVKDAASIPYSRTLTLGALLALVLALSAGRFWIWGEMHKRYPLSLAYPASALFFPLVVVLAWAYGEKVTTMNIVGAALVTMGVALCILGNPDEAPDP
jgi:drug/metabolite transporter (DMT)-like permease